MRSGPICDPLGDGHWSGGVPGWEGLSRVTFLSADNDLNEAARAEDLTADNPNRH